MKIHIFPTDLIKMCVWDSYVYYIVGSDKEAQEILRKNEEMEISDRDALVIGLLKVLETENLIHKFNTYIVEILTNKSRTLTSKDKELMIRKKTLDTAVDKFLDKFPNYWEPSKSWEYSLNELTDYVNNMKDMLQKVELQKVIDENMSYELYPTNTIKKMLKFRY